MDKLPARIEQIKNFYDLLRRTLAGEIDISRPPPQNSSSLPPPRLSEFSDPVVQNGAWCAQNFVTGAGMVVFQPSTDKIILCYRTDEHRWFLPRGRKDIGESIEQCALREAYEETGYKVEFLPLLNPVCTCALGYVGDEQAAVTFKPNTEAIYTSIGAWRAGQIDESGFPNFQGEYITFWYVGQIGPDAVRQEGTGAAMEEHYTSYLVSYEEAISRLPDTHKKVVEYAWALYQSTRIAE